MTKLVLAKINFTGSCSVLHMITAKKFNWREQLSNVLKIIVQQLLSNNGQSHENVKNQIYTNISLMVLCQMLSLSIWCLVIVVWLFLAVPWVGLHFVIVIFPDQTHLLFLCQMAQK